MKKFLIRFILISYIGILSACNIGQRFGPEDTHIPDPAVLAGEWLAVIDIGRIYFTVMPEGTTITDVSCGIWENGANMVGLEHNGPIDISDFTADAYIAGYGPDLSLHFEFNAEGESGLVSWEYYEYDQEGRKLAAKGSNEMSKVK